MSAARLSECAFDDLSEVDVTLQTLRKPTDLKKVIDSIPKPVRSVPKNGLPMWYKLGLECKLPVPKMPVGKIVFSRGKVGEDVRRLGLGGHQPSFDLTDPYCHSVSYEYVAEHDPHLAPYFSQKAARKRMKFLGFVTKDGRAVCSLKAFNQYRKYLYNQFMDRIHVEVRKMDERAKDDLVLKRVDRDVERRRLIFIRSERAREHLEKMAQEHADEWAEKKRRAKEQEKKIQARMRYLSEFKERQRIERVSKAREKETRIKQRVQAAAELELRRKITMVRTWKSNEKKRLNKLRQEKEAKQRRMEDEANDKWSMRIEAQNRKLFKEAILLKLYSEDMAAGARSRMKKSDITAYNRDLELQQIRLFNLKLMHGGKAKEKTLVKKMGVEFEKSKRGAKGMSPELAQRLAVEAMTNAMSTDGDRLMTLGQARASMDRETVLPTAVLRLLEEVMEATINEFARRRITRLLRAIESSVKNRAAEVFLAAYRERSKKSGPKEQRWALQVTDELARHYDNMRNNSVCFGDIFMIKPDTTTEIDMKSVRDRPPTPVPSKTDLAEVTFADRIDDLPDPVPCPADLIERKRLLECVNIVAKLLSRFVTAKVEKGMDVQTGKVTLPNMRHAMEWGEAVEGLSNAVVESRVNADCAEVRRASVFLAHRILRSLLYEIKDEKRKRKESMLSENSDKSQKDFYVPGSVAAVKTGASEVKAS